MKGHPILIQTVKFERDWRKGSQRWIFKIAQTRELRARSFGTIPE